MDLRPRSPSPPQQDSHLPDLEPLINHVAPFNSLSPPMSPAMGNHVDLEDRRLAMVLTEISSNHVPELSKREIAEIRRHNLNIRMLAYKEVRRPGKSK